MYAWEKIIKFESHLVPGTFAPGAPLDPVRYCERYWNVIKSTFTYSES